LGDQVNPDAQHILQEAMQIHDFPPHRPCQFYQDVDVTEGGIVPTGMRAEHANTTDPVCLTQGMPVAFQYRLNLRQCLQGPVTGPRPYGLCVIIQSSSTTILYQS
jgi:hypothetical protein